MTYAQQAKLDHTLRDLIHFVDGPCHRFGSGCLKEILPAGSIHPTRITWWTSAARTHKICEQVRTYQGNDVVSESWTVFDTDGVAVLARVVDAITYVANREATRTRTVEVPA